MKHLHITYTTESGSKIVLFDDEVAEVTWSDGSGVVRVEGKTQAAASSGMNLLEMLTGGNRNRPEAEEEAPQPATPAKASKPVKKAAASKPVAVVDAD